MLRSTYNRGIQMTFQNGLTISIQFGCGNYCERRSFTASHKSELNQDVVESKDAEIAIWDENGKWFNFGNDTIIGWIEADEVADWINRTKNASNIEDL